MQSREKRQVTRDFGDHVSRGKADFFKKYGMNFVMGRREGPWLWDLDGKKRLYNLHCNGGVFNLGHRNGEIAAVLRGALDELDIGNHHFMSAERARLARRLADLLPGNLTRTIFGVSGGEAMDLAIKIARAHTGRAGIVSVIGGYHGHTGLALAAGDSRYRAPFGPPAPGFTQVPFNDIPAMIDAVNVDTAAVIIETIPATLGMALPDPAWLAAVRNRCNEAGALLVLDEVQAGLGRTGRLWAFEHFGIEPDILVLGKGLSGGYYPITATVYRDDCDDVFRQDPFVHISTFGGAEPGCRVARAVLDMAADPGFLGRVNRLSNDFAAVLAPLVKKHRGFLKGVRRLGLMMGLELKDGLAGPVFTKAAYDCDLLCIYAGNDTSVAQLLPPLVMDPADLPWVGRQLDAALSRAKKLHALYRVKRSVESVFRGGKEL